MVYKRNYKPADPNQPTIKKVWLRRLVLTVMFPAWFCLVLYLALKEHWHYEWSTYKQAWNWKPKDGN